MITGIGTDIIDIRRIEKLIKKSGWESLAKKILSTEELKNLKPKQKNCAKHLAKRFAAKEAIAKATGTGIGANLSFQDITITSNNKNKPLAKIKNRNVKIHISISDEHPFAVAFAVISRKS
jgi:holo-[acyl-carrier protein] synthase